MRRLILIPIVHTPEDMGSMKDGLMRESIAKVGQKRWEENVKRIGTFWGKVTEEINALMLDLKKTRIYQDGLPAGGELGLKIVRETAKKGSRNYQIIEGLIEKGATIEATESPDLLREEFGYIKSLIEAPTEEGRAEAGRVYEKTKDDLLNRRDSYIAGRVAESLKAGETGILFLGASHNVIPLLPKDIKIQKI